MMISLSLKVATPLFGLDKICADPCRWPGQLPFYLRNNDPPFLRMQEHGLNSRPLLLRRTIFPAEMGQSPPTASICKDPGPRALLGHVGAPGRRQRLQARRDLSSRAGVPFGRFILNRKHMCAFVGCRKKVASRKWDNSFWCGCFL